MAQQNGDSFMNQGKLLNYGSERGARAYRADYDNKLHRKISDRRERKIFRRYFALLGHCSSILDVPCGAGRLQQMFRGFADRVYEGDWSPTMLQVNREEHGEAVPYIQCSALELPFADRSVDVVVSVRLSHHLEQIEDRENHIRELMRVADRAVVCTWFSATSIKNRLRELRVKFAGRRSKNVLHTRRVAEIAQEQGFSVAAATPLARLTSGHVFGLFTRQ